MINHQKEIDLINQIIKTEVEPFIEAIDHMLYYPGKFQKALGNSRLLSSSVLSIKEVRGRELQLIEKQ